MIVGYILLIIIPFLSFASFMYLQLNDKLTSQVQLSNQKNIEQIAANLDSVLLKIESLYSIYQNNVALIDYMRGDEISDRDLIYSYLKEMSPAFSFATLAVPEVEKIVVYPKNQNKLLSVDGFMPYDKWRDSLTASDFKALSVKDGLWKTGIELDPFSLVYYHKIYNDQFTNDLGILAITVHSSPLKELASSLQEMHPGNRVILADSKESILYDSYETARKKSIHDVIGQTLIGSNSGLTDQYILNSAVIKRLGYTIIEMNQRQSLIQILQARLWWLTAGGILLLLLTASYYVILSSLTKRMLLLSRHMRKVEADSLGMLYTGPTGKDEFGFLITNYNAMITRMDELVNRVQRTELLQKDAEFKMLQAQIQPHFLYNTLETMRMLARSNGDSIVSDMAYSLGNLLRYNLARKDVTTLGEEWENIRQYLAIHQIRMPDLQIEWVNDQKALNETCPKFILQPLVENSILHGFSRRRGEKRISVQMLMEGNYVVIEIADNGAGIDEARLSLLQLLLRGSHTYEELGLTDTGGIGLGNVVQRIKAYFGPSSSFTIDSQIGEGTLCSLKLFLKERENAEIVNYR